MSDESLEIQAEAAERALAAGRGDAHDCMVAALGRSARDDLSGAEVLFERAIAMEPGNPAVLTGLAILRRKQGRMREAVLACDAAIRAMPGYADAWLERGAILAAGGSSRAAWESFARAAQLAPQLAQAHAGLAALAARDGDFVAARRHADDALDRDPGNTVALCARANADIAEQHPELAKQAMAALIARLDQPSADRSFAATVLGDACDKLGEYSAAFEAYAGANSDFAAVNAGAAAGHPSHREFVEAIHAGLAAQPAGAWRAPSPDRTANRVERHVFLLGYPRSGTTLLENVLASLPGVAALEERPTLAATDQEHLLGNRDAVISAWRSSANWMPRQSTACAVPIGMASAPRTSRPAASVWSTWTL